MTPWVYARLCRYKYSHEGYYPIKGESNRFVETGSFTNQSGVELLTYSTPPKFRPGNGICNPQIPKAIWIMAPTVGSPATRWSSTAHQVRWCLILRGIFDCLQVRRR